MIPLLRHCQDGEKLTVTVNTTVNDLIRITDDSKIGIVSHNYDLPSFACFPKAWYQYVVDRLIV